MNSWIINVALKHNKKNKDEGLVIANGASMVGIFLNIVLVIMKLAIGLISHSVSIVNDSLNNLSDCVSNVIALLSYYIAEKPADKHHPYGHQRIEYIATLFIGLLIGYVGIQGLIESIQCIITPNELNVSLNMLFILVLSIVIKLWMGQFYKYCSIKAGNSTLKAASVDSYSDSLITSASLISLVLSLYVDLPLDGIMGCVVAFVILKQAYELLKDCIDELISQQPDEQLSKDIVDTILKDDLVLGVHDLTLHYYGKTVYGSGHVEVSRYNDLMNIHNHVDLLERKIAHDYHVNITLHIDPIDLQDPLTNTYYHLVLDYLNMINILHIHDFRLIQQDNLNILQFDIVLPYDTKIDTDQLTKTLEYICNQENKDFPIVCEITYDYQ